MKNFRYMAYVCASFLFVACGQPAPNGNTTVVGGTTQSDQIVGDTVEIDEGRYSGTEGRLRGGADGSSYMNSSADGFYSVYFDFDRYDISPDMYTRIEQNVQNAKRRQGRIRIEGNCDEFGTDEYNYALGLKRAKAVKDAMRARGVAANRMILVSYGESNPVCNEQTAECYRRNRRADLRLVR